MPAERRVNEPIRPWPDRRHSGPGGMIMRFEVAIFAVLLVTAMFASACASRSWTENLFAKQEVRIDEQGERLGELGNRVTTLETSVTQARAAAQGARDVAEIALARTDAADGRRSRLASLGGVPEPQKGRSLFSVVHVRFGVDRADLDGGAEKALAAVLRELRENPSLTVDLEGTTDTTGSAQYNMELSRRRVDAVRRYLLTRGIETPRVGLASAVGPLTDSKIPAAQKRRVAVKFMQASE
jgi:outer membrane protein OmpA-like peptidoglycan-associated protein